jgi:hypothetical protein
MFRMQILHYILCKLCFICQLVHHCVNASLLLYYIIILYIQVRVVDTHDVCLLLRVRSLIMIRRCPLL